MGWRVIRGNLLLVPIANSILYVSPLYLRAETGQVPELKRVIAAYGDRVVMDEMLEGAIAALFKESGPVSAVLIPPINLLRSSRFIFRRSRPRLCEKSGRKNSFRMFLRSPLLIISIRALLHMSIALAGRAGHSVLLDRYGLAVTVLVPAFVGARPVAIAIAITIPIPIDIYATGTDPDVGLG